MACIFNYTIITYSKSSLELNPLIQNGVQQDYLPELYPKYPRFDQKCPFFDVALLHAPGVDCSPFPRTFVRNPGDEGAGGSHPATKFTISHTRKIPLNKFTSSPIKSVIPFPSNNNFYVITLYKLHL